MSLKVTVVGSYPKPPVEGGEFTLRKTRQAIDRGDATWEDVEKAQDSLAREVIEEQERAGIELVTDGQVRWDDGQTRFAEGLEGFTIGGLIRYFDNNTYFRQPTIKGQVSRKGPIVVDEFKKAEEASSVPVKAVITGPYTLAALSVDEFYNDGNALLEDLTRAMNEEARDLVAAGATVIAFDEPALARVPGHRPGDLELFAAVAPKLVDGVQATTVLQTYFGDIADHGADYFRLPFDVFGLDLVAGPGNRDAIGDLPPEKTLQGGIVDARNTKLEPVDSVVATIRDLANTVGPDRLWISPSSGLEYLPREAAERKCRRLAEAAKKYREEA
ncbi:MAG TPA: methylcobamide--CoM methyltransferase [Actinomycetota bacterium]|nr:methylcobamide--CoM methyltransferase [Actinomycetota bacterium]